MSKAAENSLLNGAESERTVRVRAQLKAGKKRLQELEKQQQLIVEEERDIIFVDVEAEYDGAADESSLNHVQDGGT